MKILFVSKWSDACSYYRMISPAKYLNREEGVEARTTFMQAIPDKPDSGIKERDVEWADVVVFQRPISKEDGMIISQIKRLRPTKVVLGEYDDDYSSVPWWNPGYTYLKAKEEEWKSILPHFDGITVSTENLAEAFKKVAKEQKCEPDFRVIKNAIDFEIFDDEYRPVNDHQIAKPFLTEAKDKNGLPDVVISQKLWGTSGDFVEYAQDKIVIGWFGSRTHFFDLDWVIEDLRKITQKHKDVVVLFLGYLNFRAVTDIDYEQIFMTNGASPTSRYYHLLKTLPIDISLCPVDPNPFNKSKSAIKYLESVAAECLPVVSEFDTYETEFHQGFLVNYRYGAWEQKLEQAIDLVRKKEHVSILHENRRHILSRDNMSSRIPEYLNYYQDRIDFVKNGRVK